MGYLFSLTFQGQMTAETPVSSTEQRDVERLAFPSALPRDAAARDTFRAVKIAPLDERRLVLATASAGAVDRFKRPVLGATGCVLDAREIDGDLRDLAAIWDALGEIGVGEGFEALRARAAARSIFRSPEAFHLLEAALNRHGPFYAKLAAALNGTKPVDLYLGSGSDNAPERLRPALALLPLSRLRQLHLALGAEPSEYREDVLGLAEEAPAELAAENQGIRGLVRTVTGANETVAVDFGLHEVYGLRSAGPAALVEAIVDPQPWPDGLAELGRYKVLLKCIDGADDQAVTPFDLRPDLDELRQAIRRLEVLSKKLSRWR